MVLASSKLLKLLESGEFDWDNIGHRQAFLKEWANGDSELHSMGWLTPDGEGPAEDDPGGGGGVFPGDGDSVREDEE